MRKYYVSFANYSVLHGYLIQTEVIELNENEKASPEIFLPKWCIKNKCEEDKSKNMFVISWSLIEE